MFQYLLDPGIESITAIASADYASQLLRYKVVVPQRLDQLSLERPEIDSSFVDPALVLEIIGDIKESVGKETHEMNEEEIADYQGQLEQVVFCRAGTPLAISDALPLMTPDQTVRT